MVVQLALGLSQFEYLFIIARTSYLEKVKCCRGYHRRLNLQVPFKKLCMA